MPEIYYDYVILGTGLSESYLAYLLAKKGKKVLVIDKNSMYGEQFATLNFKELKDKFNDKTEYPELDAKFNAFNIDLTPKLLLNDSKFADILVEHENNGMLEFSNIKESYLFTDKFHTVPRSETQALASSYLPFFQKPKVIKFFWHLRKVFNNKDAKMAKTMREEFKSFGLSQECIDFIGHAIALNLDDSYLDRDPKETYDRVTRYITSIISFNGTESPFTYPVYGLSSLCQYFIRQAAVNGAHTMLHAQITKIDGNYISLLDYEQMRHELCAGKIISDSSYYPTSLVFKEIIRCIMICKRGKYRSRSVIFLKKNLNRQNDVFIVTLGHEEYACPPEYEIVIMSTVKETDDIDREIMPVVKKFDVIVKYTEVRNLYINTDTENVIFTKGVDESASLDSLYENIEESIEKLGF